MSNTLTSLYPELYNALNVVPRELVGMVSAVTRDSSYERAALNQIVRSPVVPAATASDITPGVTVPNDGDQTIGNVSMTINKSRGIRFRWNGEERRELDNNGAGYNVILRDQFAQAMRALCNEVETDLCALHLGASRAVGVAGTAPFGTAGVLSDSAGCLKMLEDNGAQGLDFQLVLGTAAMANLRGVQSVLFKVNEAGTDRMLRDGITDRLQGFAVRSSAPVKTFTAGTGASGTTNTAGYAVGATSITLAAAGTGTVLVGDAISFAGDTNKYIVTTGVASLAAGGTAVIAAPGLQKAIPASATNVTVSATSARNLFLARSAVALATRLPALPEQGDIAEQRTTITDPISGISFDVALYKQYRQVSFEIALAWGCAVVKPEHLGVLLG